MTNTIDSETLLRESELHPQHKTTNNIVNESSKIQRIHSLQKAKLLEINSAGFIFFFLKYHIWNKKTLFIFTVEEISSLLVVPEISSSFLSLCVCAKDLLIAL